MIRRLLSWIFSIFFEVDRRIYSKLMLDDHRRTCLSQSYVFLLALWVRETGLPVKDNQCCGHCDVDKKLVNFLRFCRPFWRASSGQQNYMKSLIAIKIHVTLFSHRGVGDLGTRHLQFFAWSQQGLHFITYHQSSRNYDTRVSRLGWRIFICIIISNMPLLITRSPPT